VREGEWRPQVPEVTNHHGYKLNALVSLLPHTGWTALARNYVAAKRGGPSMMQVFVNQTLANTWRVALNKLDAETLRQRVEDFGLAKIPPWCLMLTVGADIQDDRIEASVVGWGIGCSPTVLGHAIINGSTVDDDTWQRFDKWLKRKYKHPNGWHMKIDAAAIDSGGGAGRTQKVYDFCGNKYHRGIFAIKGSAGPRPMWKRSEKVKRYSRLYIVGHDQVKTEVMERLSLSPTKPDGEPNPLGFRYSDDLDLDWFEGVTAEIRRVRYVHNRAIIEFVPKRSGIRNEPLDCVCYAWAVRFSPGVRAIDLEMRAARREDNEAKASGVADLAARLNG